MAQFLPCIDYLPARTAEIRISTTSKEAISVRLLMALRLPTDARAIDAIETASEAGTQRGQLISSHAERQHPALRNIADYLRDLGRIPLLLRHTTIHKTRGKKAVEEEIDGKIYWCEIESGVPPHYWEGRVEVETVFSRKEFDVFVKAIRHKTGVAYVEACEEFANGLEIRSEGAVTYQPSDESQDSRAA